jgi:hypothetical protein
MINHEVTHKTYIETASQISQYFNILDQTPLMSDTDKRYFHTQNACYSPSCPVQAGSFTTVIISPSGENMADIYNGFIYAEMEVSFGMSGETIASSVPGALTWIGFKDSFDAIEKYDILAGGITVYTQNNAIEESYIMNCASTDNIKKSDVYSKVNHKNIWKERFGDQCGTWVDWATSSGDMSPNVPHTIKLKIDLRHFLPLSNIKFLPAFAGKIELKLYFGTAGLVVAVPNPEIAILDAGTFTLANYQPLPFVTTEFVQIADPISMIVKHTPPSILPPNVTFTTTLTGVTGGSAATSSSPAIPNPTKGSFESGERTIFAYRDYKIKLCETLINVFGLHHELYERLQQKYSAEPLTYPTQILQVSNMSSVLNSTSSKASQTITPRFVDSIFLLFPEKVNQRTIYHNPKFRSFQLTCATYGAIPNVAFGTVREPRFIEMCSNAVNLNTDTFGMSDDVINSLVQVNFGDEISRIDGTKSDDRTHFFIGLPTETDGTFQQGQTSDTPINYELSVIMDENNVYRKEVTAPPLMCLLMDAAFSIQVQPYGNPLVMLGPNDITTPIRVN